MKNEDVQDAVPQEFQTAPPGRQDADGVYGWAGNVMMAAGLSALTAPDITRALLGFPASTPVEALWALGTAMILNGITFHMLQRERRK